MDPVGATVAPVGSRAHIPAADSTRVDSSGARVDFDSPDVEESPDEVPREVAGEGRERGPA